MQPDQRARCALFTAIDGAVLDTAMLDGGPISMLLEELRRIGVPLIPVTVMTLEEIEPIAAELGSRAMVIEGGGAIARRVDHAWQVEACGPSADTLLDIVREIEERSGADLTVYSVLPPPEAALLSGLSGEMLLRSKRRPFSEPFVIDRGDLSDVISAAASIGFSVRRGRHFLHLYRECDQAEAFTRLQDELGCEMTIAVGSSPFDAEFLRRSTIPIIIPNRNGVPDAELIARVPNARIAPSPAPGGWAAAVADVLPSIAPDFSPVSPTTV